MREKHIAALQKKMLSTLPGSLRNVFHFWQTRFYPGYQRFFSRVQRDSSVLAIGRRFFARSPQPRTTREFTRKKHSKDLTETGNRVIYVNSLW